MSENPYLTFGLKNCALVLGSTLHTHTHTINLYDSKPTNMQYSTYTQPHSSYRPYEIAGGKKDDADKAKHSMKITILTNTQPISGGTHQHKKPISTKNNYKKRYGRTQVKKAKEPKSHTQYDI